MMREDERGRAEIEVVGFKYQNMKPKNRGAKNGRF